MSGRRLTRDTIILTFSLTGIAVEIVLLGARPSALTCLTGLLLSPLVLRVDEARRQNNEKDPAP